MVPACVPPEQKLIPNAQALPPLPRAAAAGDATGAWAAGGTGGCGGRTAGGIGGGCGGGRPPPAAGGAGTAGMPGAAPAQGGGGAAYGAGGLCAIGWPYGGWCAYPGGVGGYPTGCSPCPGYCGILPPAGYPGGCMGCGGYGMNTWVPGGGGAPCRGWPP
eukprot:scaffold3767_cov114-Isochrysis_galbana.AAC.18